MKYILTILFSAFAVQAFSQANHSSDFQLKVKFDTSISVSKIQPYYALKSGNRMEFIFYKIDTTENSITLTGYNDYILWVSFPTLIFSITEEVRLPTLDRQVERTLSFYLISKGPLSSYTGTQTKDIQFSHTHTTIIASLEHHNVDDAFKNLKLERRRTYSGDYDNLPLSSEIIRIGKG